MAPSGNSLPGMTWSQFKGDDLLTDLFDYHHKQNNFTLAEFGRRNT